MSSPVRAVLGLQQELEIQPTSPLEGSVTQPHEPPLLRPLAGSWTHKLGLLINIDKLHCPSFLNISWFMNLIVIRVTITYMK